MKTDEQKKGFKYIYDFVLGHSRSHPGLHAAHKPWGGHLCSRAKYFWKGTPWFYVEQQENRTVTFPVKHT